VIETTTSLLNGTAALSTAMADVTLPAGAGTMAAILRTDPFDPGSGEPSQQMAATSSSSTALERMRITLDGEPVTAIERAQALGSSTRSVEYVTASGRRSVRSLP
jgi:hypothetical protein